MASYRVPYGHGELSFELPDGYQADWIAPGDVPADEDPRSVVCEAVEHPLGGGSIDQFHGVRSAAIAINDKTRPVPHQFLLPPLLQWLEKLGLPPEKILLIVATGTHTPTPPEEFANILPQEILERYPVISHNTDDEGNLVDLGVTSRGTPVWVNKQYHDADLRIVVGNIEPHHFMGFSGGVKSAAIGLTGRNTINQNHIMLMDAQSRVAAYHSPIRQDVEEIGQKIGVHLALNAVLNGKKQIVQAFFGEPVAVMLAGIPVARKICQTPVQGLYDLVIASVGGHPKDINLYQSQKALTHASMLTRDGGVAVLVAACPEGSGSATYEQFVNQVSSHQEAIARFKEMGFRVGPHKAYQIARDATRIHVILVSTMEEERVRRLLLAPASDIQSAIHQAFAFLPANARIAVLPRATNTIPVDPGQIEHGA